MRSAWGIPPDQMPRTLDEMRNFHNGLTILPGGSPPATWFNDVLDIFEDKLRNASAEVHRPRIEHAQIMTPSDLERTARLGGKS